MVWQTPGAGSFTALSNGGAVSGATSNTLTINPATEALTGYQYEAQFNSTPADDTVPATLTVTGTPITAWNFTAGVGSPASGGTNYGSGNSPATTLNNVSGSPSANAQTLGLTNDYAGVKAFSESDILPIRSATNTTFQQYDWRLRSGSGLGPVGGPGSPEGWSQTAPEYDLISAGSTGKFGDAIVPRRRNSMSTPPAMGMSASILIGSRVASRTCSLNTQLTAGPPGTTLRTCPVTAVSCRPRRLSGAAHPST